MLTLTQASARHRARHLRLPRVGPAGVAAPVAARLPQRVHEDRDDPLARRRRDHRQSDAPDAGDHAVRRRRRPDRARARSFRSCSSRSRAARSRASTRSSPSGTTPKMIDKERDIRPIGYGAMLMEGLVGVMALVAACSLQPGRLLRDQHAARRLRDARHAHRRRCRRSRPRCGEKRRRAAPAARCRSRSAWRRSSAGCPA